MNNSEYFRKMAERIDHNAPTTPVTIVPPAQGVPVSSTFGGAAVIVPPAQGGEAVELLVLDAKGDPAQFWGTILTRVQMEVRQLEDKQRIMQGFGGGR